MMDNKQSDFSLFRLSGTSTLIVVSKVTLDNQREEWDLGTDNLESLKRTLSQTGELKVSGKHRPEWTLSVRLLEVGSEEHLSVSALGHRKTSFSMEFVKHLTRK
jgi:hypothetical protein